MTPKEFTDKQADLQEQYEAAKKGLKELSANYIHDHREFFDGQRVWITPEAGCATAQDRPRFGYIALAYIGLDLSIQYKITKANADGSKNASNARDYLVTRHHVIYPIQQKKEQQ